MPMFVKKDSLGRSEIVGSGTFVGTMWSGLAKAATWTPGAGGAPLKQFKGKHRRKHSKKI